MNIEEARIAYEGIRANAFIVANIDKDFFIKFGELLFNELDKNTEIISDLQNEVTLKDAELDKKDKAIDGMSMTMSALCTGLTVVREQFEKQYCEFIKSDEDCCWKTDKECADCIKEYFYNKVK